MIAKPKVSFLTPAYNEEKHIEKTILSIEEQDYPRDRIEIIIADGNSSDKTVEIVKKLLKEHKNIKLFANPSRNTAVGRNICLSHATGSFIFNYSGHAYAAKDLVSILVKKFAGKPKKVMGIGVSSNPPDEELNFSGQCIQTVFSTFLGGAGMVDQNRALTEEQEVRSCAFTLYRKEAFDKVGKFDKDLWVGQDGEFNLRLNNAGYKIVFTPDSFVRQQKRDSPERFFRQMYNYGIAAALRIKKHPDSFRLYYILPSIGVVFLSLLVILSLFSRGAFSFLGDLVGIYVIVSIIWAFSQSRTLLISLASPFFYFLVHAGYGLGYIDGFLKKKFR